MTVRASSSEKGVGQGALPCRRPTIARLAAGHRAPPYIGLTHRKPSCFVLMPRQEHEQLLRRVLREML